MPCSGELKRQQENTVASKVENGIGHVDFVFGQNA